MKLIFRATALASFLLLLVLVGCGDDDGNLETCTQAWEISCACENVSCSGAPTSCTGPDLEWAECILAAEDACTASCE